ncbi:hypothetical protein HHK36_029426 [Tetracentron sinense]|uniref:FRIGIDA-like protein n=1 Tax=Tetracentron sinense TaxID=13715 RepID=A0A834YF67_TETSI|nr:hypothetical protein HHK36_029426 [Tetracentron sinense]
MSSDPVLSLSHLKEEEEPAAAAAAAALPLASAMEEGQEATASTDAPEKEKEEEAPYLKSVNELRGLATSLSTFRRRWDEFQKHLDFIQNAIATALSNHTAPLPTEEQQQQQLLVSTPASVAPDSPISSHSELIYLCEKMSSRSVRKYIASHMSDIPKLREEVPAALKGAPNPSKLVMECIGRFYLQGTKAYCKDSPMIPARQVSLLILEFLLLMGCTEIEPSVKEEAEVAAIAWRKRLISEGGVSKANEIDARGLLLFVGSFGIPTVFGKEDLRDLILLSNPSEIADALRRSPCLLERVPDIIQGMLKNGMHIEAVDVAYTFGVEDKFHPKTILTSFLRESKEVLKKTRRGSNSSPLVLKEATEKQIAALKSITKCLENHKIDAVGLLPGWQMREKIAYLEKEIADLDKKIEEKTMSKRKAVEVESSKRFKIQEVKRPRPAGKVSPMIFPAVIGSQESQEQKAVGFADGKSLYDDLAPKNFLDGGYPSLLHGYSAVSSRTAAAVPDGRGAGHLAVNIFGTVAGINGGFGAGITAAGVLSTGPYAGIGGGMPAGDGVGQMASSGGPYVWHGDGAFYDNSVGQSFAGQPASMGRGLFRASPSVEQGHLGLSTTQSLGLVNQSSGADLYRFADSVFEGEQYYSNTSRTSNPMPPAASGHGPSYYY